MMAISIYLAAKIEEEANFIRLELFLQEFFKKDYLANQANMPNGYPGEIEHWTDLEIELCKTLNFEF